MPTADCSSPLFTEEDAIISDALNHASIIDGVRLKAKMPSLCQRRYGRPGSKVTGSASATLRIIATDGVFDGRNVAPNDRIINEQKYDALVMIDESHSAGLLWKTGRGVTEKYNRTGKAEISQQPFEKRFMALWLHYRTQRNY